MKEYTLTFTVTVEAEDLYEAVETATRELQDQGDYYLTKQTEVEVWTETKEDNQ